MKLYYYPGACSLSAHIILREAALDFTIEKVDITTKKTEQGIDFYTINPKGQVPLLITDSGEKLTETAIILQYLADQNLDRKLIARQGAMQRYHQLEMLNYIATELHKNLGPLFSSAISDEHKKYLRQILINKFQYIEQLLTKHAFISGDSFSVADAYLFTVSRWAKVVDVDIADLTHLQSYLVKIAKRPKVLEALETEGLI